MSKGSPIKRRSMSFAFPFRSQNGEWPVVRCQSRTFMRIRETPSGRLTTDKVRSIPVFKTVFANLFADGRPTYAKADKVIEAVFDGMLTPPQAKRALLAEA